MSSARPVERKGISGRLARMPLRTRLLAAVIGLLAVVSVIVGVATELAVRGFLMHHVDSQLSAAAERQRGGPGGDDGHRYNGGPPGFPFINGQAAGTLQAHVSNGTVDVVSVVLGDQVPESDYAVL